MLNGTNFEQEKVEAKPKKLSQTFNNLLETDAQLSNLFGGLKSENAFAKDLRGRLSSKLL